MATTTEESTTKKELFHRVPFTGSCHCGTVRYIVWLSVPKPDADPSSLPKDSVAYHQATGQHLYKCNCTPCHKYGLYHLRLADSPNDFILLQPRAPLSAQHDPKAWNENTRKQGTGLTDYRCNSGKQAWLFCSTCGVRTFSFRGEGEVVVTKVPAFTEVPFEKGPAGKKWEGKWEEQEREVWRPKKEGWKEGKGGLSYMSVNLTSVDPGQEGFDMRDYIKHGWTGYFDYLRETRRGGSEPFEGGMY